MEHHTLTSLRNEVLDALRKSITDFAVEAELDPVRRQDTSTASRANWVIAHGRKSLHDLTLFLGSSHLYSGEDVASYIWISCMFKEADSGNTRCFQMESLEQFWSMKDILQWDTRPENIFCMFAKSDRISAVAKDPGFVRLLIKEKLPSTDAICQSAVVALLFLLKRHLTLTVPDLHHLIAGSLGHTELGDSLKILRGLSEEDLCLDTDSDTPWHSISSAAVAPTAFSKSSTKILTFPGKLPEYQTAYKYMDIYQPHGSQPVAKSSCAIWGAWKDQRTWRSVASFSNRRVAELYGKLLQRGNTSSPEQSSLLSSHWINLLRCVYKIGINDGRLILRDAAKDIEHIRYKSSAKPSIDSANVCLMYLNHFDYFKYMTKALCEEVESYPSQWWCPALGKMAAADWIQEVGHECESLHKEVLVVTNEVKDVRKLILEQHNLLESRKTSLLTLLASIFVPMSFVASFFGMNTSEINGSAWHIEYYFITAVPLVALTILLPLIILPAFNFVSRHLVARSVLWGYLHWICIITSFVLNLYMDIVWLVHGLDPLWYEPIRAVFIILLALLALAFLSGFCSTLPPLARLRLDHLPSYVGTMKWHLLCLTLAVGAFTVRLYTTYPFLELPPYLMYFFIVWYRNRKPKNSEVGHL